MLIMEDIILDYLVINETKLDDIFPIAQFYLREFEIRARRDGVKYGGGLNWFVGSSFISRRLKNMNQKIAWASVSYLQSLRKSGYVLVYIDLQQPPT